MLLQTKKQIIELTIPVVLQESSIIHKNTRDAEQVKLAKNAETKKRSGKFHASGYLEGLTVSYPIEMRVASFKMEMNIKYKTGT